MKNELKRFQIALSQKENKQVLDGEDEEQWSCREAFLKITLHFLRRMKQNDVADCLMSSKMSLPT